LNLLLPIITDVVSSNPAKARYARYNIMIKFVSDLREVGGFLPILRVLQFPPQIKLTVTI
jgi:hypothetical protein